MVLWPAPDQKKNPEIPNFGHDRALSIRNFMLMTATPSNYSFEHLCYGHNPIKVPKNLLKGLIIRFLIVTCFNMF
jgi:hypothetical protein